MHLFPCHYSRTIRSCSFSYTHFIVSFLCPLYHALSSCLLFSATLFIPLSHASFFHTTLFMPTLLIHLFLHLFSYLPFHAPFFMLLFHATFSYHLFPNPFFHLPESCLGSSFRGRRGGRSSGLFMCRSHTLCWGVQLSGCFCNAKYVWWRGGRRAADTCGGRVLVGWRRATVDGWLEGWLADWVGGWVDWLFGAGLFFLGGCVDSLVDEWRRGGLHGCVSIWLTG